MCLYSGRASPKDGSDRERGLLLSGSWDLLIILFPGVGGGSGKFWYSKSKTVLLLELDDSNKNPPPWDEDGSMLLIYNDILY